MAIQIFQEMLGKTMVSVKNARSSLLFTDSDGETYEFRHDQDCCECVIIEDICGDLTDLEGSYILQAEEVSMDEPFVPDPETYDHSYTWTFYKFATIKGTVTVRWLGTSNGYYSEGVSYYTSCTS